MSYTKGQRVRIINPRSCWDSKFGTVVKDDGELVEVDIPGRDFTYSFKHTDIEPALAWRTGDEKCRRCGAVFKHSDALREHWESEHREEAMQSEEIEEAKTDPEVVHPTRATIIREDGKPAYIEFEADGRLLVAGYLYPTAEDATAKAAEDEPEKLKVGDRVRSTAEHFYPGHWGVVKRVIRDDNESVDLVQVILDGDAPSDRAITFYATSLEKVGNGTT